MTYLISEIEKLYPDWHDKSSDLSYDDQKWIWENLPLPKADTTAIGTTKLSSTAVTSGGSPSWPQTVTDMTEGESVIGLKDNLYGFYNKAPGEDERRLKGLRANKNVGVNGSINEPYKSEVKSELNWYKSELIFQLKQSSSKTPQNKVASLLKEIFKFWPSKEGHWLWVAQTYTTRVLNWVMAATVKEYLRGGIRKTPAAYFTYLLRYRKQRKQFRNTNGAHKTL